MASFRLRPAAASDSGSIRALIWKVGINPTRLNWQRFVLAVDETGAMVGCGQVKQHSDSTRVLASIAVEPAWRGRGVARAIISHLIEQHPGTLYLTCRTSLSPFYEKFGFRRVEQAQLPPHFQRVMHLSSLAGMVMSETWLVMKKEGDAPAE